MNKYLKFIIIFLPWFFSGFLFQECIVSYQSLNLPIYALPQYMYGIVWSLLYILISISIYKIYSDYKFKEIKNYNTYLIMNYIFNQLFIFLLFCIENTMLAFIDTLLILITSLLLYLETNTLNKNASKFLKPYLYFNVYACILSLTIYFLNL